ncbi:hypothetical protein, partial [Rikenella microfusus]|uniref:hypothetical protein n=1 Tax=Rikenella microfusus TaxID=28139 RepID=UPI003AB52B66
PSAKDMTIKPRVNYMSGATDTCLFSPAHATGHFLSCATKKENKEVVGKSHIPGPAASTRISTPM